MHKRVIHRCFILLAILMVWVACARNPALSAASLPEPLPVIHGYINGVKAVAQGDMVFFFVGRQSVRMGDSCGDDLNCIMQKYRIDVVAVNSRGLMLILQNHNIHEEAGDISDFIFPSPSLDTPTIEATRSQPLFISTRQSEITPAPASFTLHTGIPVIDQTSALAFINSETTSLLTNTITVLDLLSTSGRFTESFTQVEPILSRTAPVFPTATVEAESIPGLLVPSGTVPTSVEIEQGGELGQEHSTVRLETSTDILEIRPTPGYDSTGSSSSQWTFTVRELSNTVSESSFASVPTPSPTTTEVGRFDHSNQVSCSTLQCKHISTQGVVAVVQSGETITKKEATEPTTNADVSELQDAFRSTTLEDEPEVHSKPDENPHLFEEKTIPAASNDGEAEIESFEQLMEQLRRDDMPQQGSFLTTAQKRWILENLYHVDLNNLLSYKNECSACIHKQDDNDLIETLFPDEYFIDPVLFNNMLTHEQKLERLRLTIGSMLPDLYSDDQEGLNGQYQLFFNTNDFISPNAYMPNSGDVNAFHGVSGVFMTDFTFQGTLEEAEAANKNYQTQMDKYEKQYKEKLEKERKELRQELQKRWGKEK